jgi:hypothetical protein
VGNIGNNEASSESPVGSPWHFRGQDLVKATLLALQGRARHPLAAGHVVYFGGCSAGGRGAMFNLEYLPDMLPTGVKTYGVFDSPMWVDVEPLVPGGVSFHAQTEGVLKMTNASARLGRVCRTIYTKVWWRVLGVESVG